MQEYRLERGASLRLNSGETLSGELIVVLDQRNQCDARLRVSGELPPRRGDIGSVMSREESDHVGCTHVEIAMVSELHGGGWEVALAPLDISWRNDAVLTYVESHPIPSGTEFRVRWWLSGCRLLADVLAAGDLAVTRTGLPNELALRLTESVSTSVVPSSGNVSRVAIQQPMAELVFGAEGMTLAESLGVVSACEAELDHLAYCLSYRAGATVQWIMRTEAIAHEATENVVSWTRRFPKVVTPASGAAPPSSDACAWVREHLDSNSSNLAAWGDHAKNAIDFLLVASALPNTSAFIALCTALESVQEAYAKASGTRRLVKETQFSRIRPKLREAVLAQLLAEDTPSEEADGIVELMNQKLPELNRRPFRNALEELFRAFEIDSSGVDGSDYRFLRLRNEMIHAGIAPPLEELAAQMRILEVIVSDAVETMMERPPAEIVGN